MAVTAERGVGPHARHPTRQVNDELKALVASAPPARLLHEDLHDMNVLATLEQHRANRRAIDPKPIAGEWAYAVAPIVWSSAEITAAACSVRNHVRLRAEMVADVAELDEDRVRRWTLVRWCSMPSGPGFTGPVPDNFRTRMILLVKAFCD